jgi:hypothetical protein
LKQKIKDYVKDHGTRSLSVSRVKKSIDDNPDAVNL